MTAVTRTTSQGATSPTVPLPTHVRVAIVGAGFAGVATAIRLRRAGIHDLVVLERADRLGGTWRDNSYPGCACDIPSHLYSYSFAPWPEWTRRYAPQPEIQAYLERTATTFGVDGLLRFGAEVVGCRWDTGSSRWEVTTVRGTLTADVVVAAGGPQSHPNLPDLPGLAAFTGTAFHTAAWDHDHDLRGRRVAVVGTGASAIQAVPHVQEQAAHVLLVQRTPAWVIPRRDRAITGLERAAFRRVPALQRLTRATMYGVRETRVLGFSGRVPLVLGVAQLRARRNLAAAVRDPRLRATLTPAYTLGCKRVLLSDDYYPALTRQNVTVVAGSVDRLTARGVVTVDPAGRPTEHVVDTVVFGTGFTVTDPPIAHRVVGSDGRTLAAHWADRGMRAHLGLTVPGFPNYFHLLGPNTGIGHTSALVILETQVQYVVGLLRRMETVGVATVEPRRQVEREWNADVQHALARTVWNTGGCSSWYLDAHGRNTTLWPGFTSSYRRRLGRPRLADYVVTPTSSLS